ncbi:bi-domain-containing oxidoreductase [Legionella sp. WA2022007384]
MKQLIQDMSHGKSSIIEAPAPMMDDNSILIATSTTLISAGTERMLLDFGKASYFGKARQQPEKVKMVLDKAKSEGILTTLDAVRSKLSQPILPGYCNVGVIVEVGKHCKGFNVGDRVASNGSHADLVKVPANLCAKIPDNVDDETAAFTVLASIGLQGIRLAQPTLGEAFVVIGAGLIGMLTIQLLKAHGCRVLAIDFDEEKLKLAQQIGAETCNPSKGEDAVTAGMAFSRGFGVDGVIITASTKSNEPLQQAARMSRKRGRIVLVGVIGLELNRADFYEKELSFQVSCSYGPGRYDPLYEEKGFDYPIGFVRWTEQRNFQAVLDMMASGQLNVKPLISHRYTFEEALQAYQVLTENKSALGILMHYPTDKNQPIKNEVQLKANPVFHASKPILGFIGAGNYASRVLIPAFKSAEAQLHTLVTAGGVNSAIHGEKAGFSFASTDTESIFNNAEINTMVIVTRHNTHAELVTKSLAAGKHVFVEKPLALNLNELAEIEATYHTAHLSNKKPHLMVGFNRRFAPQIQKIKSLLQSVNEPKTFLMTMNAGAIPAEHWTQDKQIGGGRILGEACHLVDLMRFLADCEITSVQVQCMGENPAVKITEDKAAIILGFADGSFGTIHYLANGAASFPKERIEVFAAGKILQLDNFRKLTGYGWPNFKKQNLWRQDKGQEQCARAFLTAIEKGLPTPIPIEEIFEVSRVTINISDLLSTK